LKVVKEMLLSIECYGSYRSLFATPGALLSMGQIGKRYDHQQHRNANSGKNVKDGRPFEVNQRDHEGSDA
jgi:hypothetical protein